LEVKMRGQWIGWAVALAILFVVPGVRPQTARQAFGNPWDTPEMRKYWNPVVGVGEVYEVTRTAGKKSTEEFSILSEETIEGKHAYWLEVAGESPSSAGKVYVKALIIPADFEARKVVLQLPGMAAMEVPIPPAAKAPKAEPQKATKLLGTETIAVPAGTFECEHLREADGSEAWVSSKASPLKVVKSVDKFRTRVLVRMIAHPKDAITGPVKPYDPEAIARFSQRQSK
jgi:hypothetical protein